MPATSKKQKLFMDAAAHNPKFAKAAGVPVSVAKEFSGESKGMKFGKDTNTSRPDLQKVNKPKTLHGKMSIMKEGGDTMATKMNPGMMAMMAKKKDGMHKMPDGKMMKNSAMKKGGMSNGGSASKRADGIATKGKTKGTMLKKGGMAC
jgi:hypothetical protein